MSIQLITVPHVGGTVLFPSIDIYFAKMIQYYRLLVNFCCYLISYPDIHEINYIHIIAGYKCSRKSLGINIKSSYKYIFLNRDTVCR